jgi:ribosomal protein S18 acetylase RimI-like enzyme
LIASGRLVEELVLRAARLGFSRMVLDTLPEMAEAIRLYPTFGFVETNRYWDNPIDRTIYLENTLREVQDPPRRAL